MTADERLSLILLKVERAKKHIRELDIDVRAFLDSGPYDVGRRGDSKWGPLWTVYYVISSKPIPPTISLIAGDALANLRGTLDHLAYQLAWVNGTRDENILKSTYFPISDDAKKYKAETPRKVRGLAQDAIRAITELTPYKEGNEMLWRLNRLNNIDKHRLLVTVGTIMEGVSSERFHWISPTNNAWTVLKAGDILTEIPTALDVDENLQFAFEIAFNEPRTAECEAVVETLQEMSELVEGVVSRFKSFLV
jgi:hypothetical protein